MKVRKAEMEQRRRKQEKRKLVQKQAGSRNDVRNEQGRIWEGKGRRKGGRER